jgi:D-serine deaminase-like pyridoxal phosphate-dependent protein
VHGSPLHRLPGERTNPARAPSENARAEERTEEAGNGILEATAHHPNSGEDQAAEADDRASVYSEGFECPHQRLSAGEVHRALCMGDARERERNKGGSHHAGSVGKFVLEVGSPSGGELRRGLVDVWTVYISVPANHRHLQRLGCSRDMPDSRG